MSHPVRKLHRLQTWDYSAPGYYFVTICTKDRRCVLSEIDNGQLRLTQIGAIAEKCLLRMEKAVPHVTVDYYCIMPNHIHGILVIGQHPPEAARSLSDLIHGYKSTVTREVNRLVPPEMRNQLWQSSFYDEIIRNDAMLLSHKQGGHQQINARIAYNEIDLVLLFTDPNTNSPHDDANMIETIRHCDKQNVPIATNLASAEMFIMGLQRGDLDWREMMRSKPRY